MNRGKSLALLVTVALAGAVMSAAIACSSDDNGDGNATPTEAGQTPSATSAETPNATDDAGALHIELNEWTITGEAGGPIPSAVAGNLTFEVHNEGETVHELVIIKTDTDPATLPVSSAKVDEEAAGELIGEVEEFVAGGIETGSFDLEAGTYALICNIPAHYEQGMYAQLIVE